MRFIWSAQEALRCRVQMGKKSKLPEVVIDSYTLSSNPSLYLYPEKATVSSCCQHLQYFSSRHSLWQIKEICNASYFSAFSETWGVWFDTYIPFFGRILHMISLDAQSLAEDLCICNLLLFTTRGRFFLYGWAGHWHLSRACAVGSHFNVTFLCQNSSI